MSQENIEDNVAETIARLIERRKICDEAFLTSNKNLYGLLGECALLAFTLQGRKRELIAVAKDLNIAINIKSDVHTIVLKLVFGDEDRRRISSYGSVLRAAAANSVPFDNFVNWIIENGGIEAIRLRKKEGSSRGDTKKSGRRGAKKNGGGRNAGRPRSRPLSAEIKAAIKAKRKALLSIRAEELNDHAFQAGDFVLMVGVVNGENGIDVLSFDSDGEALDVSLQQLAESGGADDDGNSESREVSVVSGNSVTSAMHRVVAAMK